MPGREVCISIQVFVAEKESPGCRGYGGCQGVFACIGGCRGDGKIVYVKLSVVKVSGC